MSRHNLCKNDLLCLKSYRVVSVDSLQDAKDEENAADSMEKLQKQMLELHRIALWLHDLIPFLFQSKSIPFIIENFLVTLCPLPSQIDP